MTEPRVLASGNFTNAVGRYDVLAFDDGGTLRIDVPRPLLRSSVLATIVAFGVLAPAFGLLAGPFSMACFLTVLTPYAFIYFFLAMLRREVRRPESITVGSDALVIRGESRGSEQVQLHETVLPVADVYSVRYVGHAKAIFFRAQGREIVEMPLRYTWPAGEAIAQAIRDRLGRAAGESD